MKVWRFIKLSMRRLRKAPQWVRLVCSGSFRLTNATLSATSMDLCDNPHLQLLLGERPRFHSRLLRHQVPTVVGWGRKWSGRRAQDIALREGKSRLLIEDGFVRSVGRNDLPLSIVCDAKGIFYDATVPSQLETHIKTPLSGAESARANDLMTLWRDQRVSKYNDTPRYNSALPDNYVLVIDQVYGDLSITFGGATSADFSNMLQAALDENPTSTIILKTHPDQAGSPKRSHFNIPALRQNPRIKIIDAACHPVQLIAQAKAVYTVTSQVGFEALIWGKPVRCFGMPFYAGWGLTTDAQPAPSRRTTATLAQLVHGALIKYTRYLDPETQRPCDVEVVVRHIGLQRKLMRDLPKTIYAVGFSPWKRSILRQFLPGKDLRFIKAARDLPKDATIAVWGVRHVLGQTAQQTVIRIEDGFLRSSGLGADLIKPVSWTFDDLGIYFDPKAPSRLENILQSKAFPPAEKSRARALIDLICSSGVSKYNIGSKAWRRPDTQQRVILVPGQVEADASIQAGCPEIKTNMALLAKIRAENPDAFILYKPHPDVVAGLRKAGALDTTARQYCDLVVRHVDPAALLAQVNEVHTLTSLMGFEALMRGIPVTCYGQPFYAGWGLTKDIAPPPRRTAQLAIEDLVAGALIEYPRYVSRVSGRLTTPERAILELSEWRQNGPSQMPVSRRMLRSVLRLWAQTGLKRST